MSTLRARRPVTGAATAVSLIAVLAAAALTGCTGGEAAAGDTGHSEEASVIAPGRPGEDARTISPQEAREAAEEGTAPNAADHAFMTMMIGHHEQAVEMTDLAEEFAHDASVRGIAGRIAATQGPEIEIMRAWLLRNAGGEQAGDDAHQGHGEHGADMPGMASAADMERLRAARGADFDALFLELMIAHHEGALTMAADVSAQGNDGAALELAAEIGASQRVEIARMEALL
ncbi:hypothetical protein SUDANB171_00362 [Streptomyces sp. enrichment culture]|uniref:DUF305 domain-containing protein n=1 Tax=Streptomyces xiamenensis TaxID=408015 RepID=UPI0037D43782